MSGKIPNKIHFQSTGAKHPEYRRQLRVKTGHLIEQIRGAAKQPHILWTDIGSCLGDFTFTYHTDSVEIIKHFRQVFLEQEHLNNHLTHRTLDIKYYDPRGWEYIIVDRNPKSE